VSKAWSKGSTAGWRRLRAAVLARDGYRCQIKAEGCLKLATCVDHIVPKGKGIEHPSNLRAACQPCNSSRGNGSSSDPAPSGRW